ncbi:MAG: UDP-N-acetylmuramoyl-L-alanine--D-glutamate ligase [Omnitrophica WOR_2 bacterium]
MENERKNEQIAYQKDWTGQRVVILGAARQGLALARYLAGKGARLVINDRKPAADLLPARQSLSDLPDGAVKWVCGDHPLDLLQDTDLICLSGGVSTQLPIVQEALRLGIPITNDSQIFMDAVPCPVIGITGSAGKTTTTTIVGRVAASAVEGAWVGGNIGLPLISQVDKMSTQDLAIVEFSSFQLELMTRSPQVAAILNITPNHLDRHPTMEAYTAAKARILDFQAEDNFAVLGRDDPGAWELAPRVKGRLLTFGTSSLPNNQAGTYIQKDMLYLRQEDREIALMPRPAIRLRGEHNLLNVLAACAIAAAAGLPAGAMQAGVEGFTGVPHRLELVRVWNGSSWYNDSIATAPERAMAAIRSFDEPIVLLAGGRDKNLPWQEFAQLVKQRIDHLILFGEAAEKIEGAIQKEQNHSSGRPYSQVRCICLEEAVQAAARVVEPGDVVLLSPGGTSFDEFRDFEERGEAFRRWVMKLS